MNQENPFIIEGYVSEKYFCDRTKETQLLGEHIANGRNVVLIAKRRMGKSGLIHNLFCKKEISETYHTFYIDLYETKNMDELVFEMAKNILSVLKTKGRKAWESFLSIMVSLQHTITFNSDGMPVWSLKIGDIKHPDTTLDEIFLYLNTSSTPCIVALDEFQVIAEYPDKKVEAALRTRIQNCHNARFIYSGSYLHTMTQMFVSPSRPFYNSCVIMGLDPIDKDIYFDFANNHFANNAQSISSEAFSYLYDKFNGVTWYIQYVLNILYSLRTDEITFSKENVERAVMEILKRNNFVYSSLLFMMTSKQKQLLYAIATEGAVTGIMAKDFLHKYSLSSSTVQTALKALTERDLITRTDDARNAYIIYDKFFSLWLKSRAEE